MATKDFKRKLSAILSADVAGYSRLMGEDEAATVSTLETYREVMSTLIKQHRGRVVDSPGDNVLAEFASVVDAVQCGVAVQNEFQARNAELPENRRMQFRIGINLGDVIEEGDRIYGDGVNIAARLEALANPGGICISKTAFDHIETKLPLGYEYLGDQTVKNIAKPVGAYRVLMEPRVTVAEEIEKEKAVPVWRRKAILAGGAVLVLVIIAALIWNFYFRPPPIDVASVEKMAHPLPDKPSIAVLPFENLSGDPNQEYFSDGLTDQIITALSNVNNMFVIARNSTFTYKGKPMKVKQVAEELGVRYVLEGTIRKAGDRVRITAQLIDAMTGHHLWAERYDRQPKDIFDVQDEITKKIIIALQVELTEGEQARVYAKATDNFEAYEKFLRGMEYFLRFNEGDNFLARQAAAEAIALDPEYATAYTLLGFTHLMDVNWSKSPRNSMEQALQAAQRALALDESFPPTHNLLCAIYRKQRQWEKAIAEGKRAIALNPNYARGHMSLADTMLYAGRFEEAIEHAKKAIHLNPYYHPRYLATLGRSYQMAGYHEEALRVYKEYRVRCEKWKCPPWWGRLMLASTYIELGQEDEARAHIAEVLRARPDYSLEKYAKTIPFKDPAHSKRILDALQKAGLPDGTSSLPLPDRPSIAVLPFANMSGDPEQEYFCDGIADQIINSIAKIPYIMVIARNSSFAYKGKSVNVQQIARDLGVRYILEGSLQRDSENVRINVQLIDAKTGGHLWAENYDRKLDDIFSVQDEICKSIMLALQVKLTMGEQALMGADTENIKAYEKYLKAREHYLRRIWEETLVARQLFQEAIALDPQYAMAYVEIGWTYLDDIWLGMTKTPSESIAKAEEMVQKAISIRGPTAGENALLSGIHLLKKDWEKAIAYGEKAVEQTPNRAGVHSMLAYALRSNGQYDEAILSSKKALRLNPVKNINRLEGLAWAYLYSKQYEKTISTWNEILERNPDHLYSYVGLTMAYWLTGSEDQARQAAQQVLRIKPKFSVDYIEKRSTIKDKALKDQLFDALRKAGLK